MNWLGIDLECNLKGTWNVGIALFSGRKTLAHFNVFIEENYTEDEKAYDFSGEGKDINKYRKSREYLDKMRAPVWVKTVADADSLVSSVLTGWTFSRSFGYNSNTFDLAKLDGEFPKTLALILDKPHMDLMPLVQAHLLGRKSYKAYWEKHVELGNTREGNPHYAKFNAELVLNYIADLQYRREGKTWIWKKEKHVGVEDLVEFEYPILHYFVRILKKSKAKKAGSSCVKWSDRISTLPLGEKEE